MKWGPGFSRIFAAAWVSVAVLLGAMIAAGPTDAAPTAAPPELDWLTIEAEPAPLPPTEQPEPPLESFRPQPPVATPRELAAKVEALDVRVAKLEETRIRSTPSIATTPTVTVSPMVVETAAPRTVCTNGVCRIVPQSQPRAVAPRGWRLFRR